MSEYNFDVKKITAEVIGWIQEWIQKNGNDETKVVIGVSGGKDSIALLTILANYKKFAPEKFDLIGININVVTFAAFCDGINFDGYIITLFYIALGAVEFAVALYLFYIMFQKKESDNIEKYSEL